eukprot:2084291-Amphidinium_carterae.1
MACESLQPSIVSAGESCAQAWQWQRAADLLWKSLKDDVDYNASMTVMKARATEELLNQNAQVITSNFQFFQNDS